MLAACNVDVAEYLALERQHHPEGLATPNGCYRICPYNPHPRAVKLYIKEEQPFSLFWDSWVDPNEPAFTVLQEFRNFGKAEIIIFGDPKPVGWSVNWPFFDPDWTRGLNFWSYDEEKALLERFKQRSDRRWGRR